MTRLYTLPPNGRLYVSSSTGAHTPPSASVQSASVRQSAWTHVRTGRSTVPAGTQISGQVALQSASSVHLSFAQKLCTCGFPRPNQGDWSLEMQMPSLQSAVVQHSSVSLIHPDASVGRSTHVRHPPLVISTQLDPGQSPSPLQPSQVGVSLPDAPPFPFPGCE